MVLAGRRRRLADRAIRRSGWTRRTVTISGARFTDAAAIRAPTGLGGEASGRPCSSSPRGAWRRPSSSCPPSSMRDVTATLPGPGHDRGHGALAHGRVALGDAGWLVDVGGRRARPARAPIASEQLGDGSTGSALPGAWPTSGRVSRSRPVGRSIRFDLEAVRLAGRPDPWPARQQGARPRALDRRRGRVRPRLAGSLAGRLRSLHARPCCHPIRIPEQVHCLAALLGDRERRP